MSVDNDMPIVEFKNIRVHSKRITPINAGDEQRTVQAQTNSLSATYDKWASKFKKALPQSRYHQHLKES